MNARLALRLAGALALLIVPYACAQGDGASSFPASSNVPDADAPDTAPPPFDGGTTNVVDAADDYAVPDGAVECDAAPCALAISGNAGSFCALLRDGTVACWGNNDRGQLGYDSGTSFPLASAEARLVEGVAGATSVSVGDGNACARVADGGVSCWGAPDLLDAGLTPDSAAALDGASFAGAVHLDAVPPAVSVTVGAQFACATTSSGALSCWGQNQNRELGRGAGLDPQNPPAAVELGAASIATARAGFGRAFAVTTTGDVYSWGAATQFGSFGFLLGRDTSEDPDGVPALVPLEDVRALATGTNHSCAIAGREVDCWGANDQGQLGRGTFGALSFMPGATNLSFVVDADDLDAGSLPTGDVPLDVAVGEGHSCAVMGSGRVYCWGANGAGQLGGPLAVANSGAPARVATLAGPAVAVAASGGAACALLRSGAVACWGANYDGELGRRVIDQDPHADPAMVSFPR